MLKFFSLLKHLYYKYSSYSFSLLLDLNENISGSELGASPFNMSMKKEFLKMSFSLILLLTFLFTSLWLFKKFLKSKGNIFNKSSLIKIIDKKSLSQKSSLYIIQIANKLLVISESSSGIQYLSELPQDTDLQNLFQENINTAKKSFSSNDIILRSLKKLKENLVDKQN